MKRAEIYKDKKGEWRSRIIGGSDSVFVSGEGYVNRTHAVKMIVTYTKIKRKDIKEVSS